MVRLLGRTSFAGGSGVVLLLLLLWPAGLAADSSDPSRLRSDASTDTDRWLVRYNGDTSLMVIKPSSFRPVSRAATIAPPSSFDLRNVDGQNYVTAIRSQTGGTCWAHGAMAAMESNLLMTGRWTAAGEGGPPNLAEYHLDWWNFFNEYYNPDRVPPQGGGLVVHEGGDYMVTAAYLSRGDGAVRDVDGQSYYTPPDLREPIYHYYYPQDIIWLTAGADLSNIDAVKEAVMAYGAVGTCIRSDSRFIDASFCHWQPPSDTTSPNHAVAIVGWDDDKETPAPSNGAWLCKNSWGSAWGLAGYFWVSYYDKWSCQHPEMGAVSFQNVMFMPWDHVYGHDVHGWRATWPASQAAFNAFRSANDYLLDAVSFHTNVDNVGYTVRVYDDFSDGELQNELSGAIGIFQHLGLHTVNLDTHIRFYAGDDFYIALELTDGGYAYDQTSLVPVLLSDTEDGTLVVSASAPGQSFYFDGADWLDLYASDTTANFCIKGLACDTSFVEVSNNFGQVPLNVQFDLSWGEGSVSRCEWTFGDGSTGLGPNVAHEYVDPGCYNVTFFAATADDTTTCVEKALVLAHADTVAMGRGRFAGSMAQVNVYLRNYLPVHEITIPFCYAGPVPVRLDSASTRGLRSEGFSEATILSWVPQSSLVTISLSGDDNRILEPGEGAIVSLYFTYTGSGESGINPVTVTEYAAYTFEVATRGAVYVPTAVAGALIRSCCVERVGDANGIGGDEPTIGDIAALIDAKYITATCDGVLACLAEADLNQSGGEEPTCDDITLADISLLIDYLFITGPSLGLAECL